MAGPEVGGLHLRSHRAEPSAVRSLRGLETQLLGTLLGDEARAASLVSSKGNTL